jgi:cell division protein FtsZ
VGDTIREFSDENATIIVGSVFDAEMADQLRVTVVATGLQNQSIKTGPRSVIDNTARKNNGTIDYKSLDNQPAITRRKTSVKSGSAAQKLDVQVDPEMDFLDVPAFLRKQAD